jgi:tRNA U34 5-carboxymethylaminomethyl modifying GTPase MnmE/TrmE
MTHYKKPLVVVVGTFQRGKSTLINGLIGCAVAEVGQGIATTHGWTLFRASAVGGVEAVAPDGTILHQWPDSPGDILQHIDIADVPGYNAGDQQGAVDATTADAALAQADMVLHLTDQTGLGSTGEREVLKRVSNQQAIVIALQNVFTPCSAQKKAEWLAVLDKQLADMDVRVWRMHANFRPLSVNALRLSQSVGAAPVDDDGTHMAASSPKVALLRRQSGLEPLIQFLSNRDPNRLGAAELCHLRRATHSWASQRAALVASHLETFIKPCQ